MAQVMQEQPVTTAPPVRSGSSTKWRVLIFILACFGILLAVKYSNSGQWLQGLISWIRELGGWGPVIFIAAYILCTVLFIPGSLLTLGAGFLFGIIYGSIYVSVASVTGAACAFLIGRYMARDWVAQKLDRFAKWKLLDQAIAAEGFKMVCLIRIAPFFPFNLLNYAFGLTRVSFRDYVLGSWLGMLPATIMYVYFGTLISDLTQLRAGPTLPPAVKWTIGVVAVVVTITLTQVARRALQQRLKS